MLKVGCVEIYRTSLNFDGFYTLRAKKMMQKKSKRHVRVLVVVVVASLVSVIFIFDIGSDAILRYTV